MHTFKPDSGNIDAWMDAFFNGLQDFKISVEQYARCAAEWDPAKVKAYLHDMHFFARGDALIRLARRIQNGDTIEDAALRVALDATSESSSWYARCLKRAIDYLVAATELWEDRIGPEAARTRFDVGVPELALAADLTPGIT